MQQKLTRLLRSSYDHKQPLSLHILNYNWRFTLYHTGAECLPWVLWDFLGSFYKPEKQVSQTPPGHATAQGVDHAMLQLSKPWILANFTTHHQVTDVTEQAKSSSKIPLFTYSPSMRSQWPVRTQIRTSITDRENESNSAAVKRPQQPKEILGTTWKRELEGLFPFKGWTLLEQGSTADESCQEQPKGSSSATNRYQNSNKIKAFLTFN